MKKNYTEEKPRTSEVVSIRLTIPEFDELKTISDEKRQTMSTLIKNLLFRVALKKRKEKE